MATKKRIRSPKAQIAEVNKEPRAVHPDLKDMIRSLRKKMGETGEEFGARLHVKRGRVSAWEQGEKPPSETLFDMARLAFRYEKASAFDFYWHAGVDVDTLNERLLEALLAQREYVSSDEMFMLPVRESARAIAGEPIFNIPIPVARIPHPESTFCILIGNESTRGPFDQGSLVIIDGSRREMLSADAKTPTLAVFFEELPHRETVSSRAERGVSWPHEELRDYLSASDRESKDEPQQGPGVRFGTVLLIHMQTDEGNLWSFTLGQHGQSRPSLTRWREGPLPRTDESAHSMLKKGIHVLGTVIGWFAPISGYSSRKEGR